MANDAKSPADTTALAGCRLPLLLPRANCREQYLKKLTKMVNSIYNGSRFEDLWLAN